MTSNIQNKMTPLVAICIPSYEKPKLFERAINSITAQTYNNYIVIITDNSKTTIIEKYIKSREIKNLVYHHNECNIGASENINLSIKYALEHHVDLIKILFQDDWFTYENSLDKMVQKYIETNADVIFAGNIEAYPNQRKERICSESQIKAIKEDLTFIYRANILGAPSNIMYRPAELFFDSEYTWLLDVDFYLRLLENKKWSIYMSL